jgi:hypothetical protein
MTRRHFPALALALACLLIGARSVAQPRTQSASDDRAMVEETLRFHNFFSRRKFDLDPTPEPFLLFVQKPDEANAAFFSASKRVFAPWLVKLGAVFKQEYVEPLGLSKREGTFPYTIAVLSSQPHYQNAKKFRRRGGWFEDRALTMGNPRVIVTYREQGSRATDADQRAPGLHEVVVELLNSHYQGPAEVAPEPWFIQGFAAFMANHDGSPANLDNPKVPQALVDKLLEWSKQEELWAGRILHIDDLLYGETDKTMERVVRSIAMNADVEAPEQPGVAFVEQAGLYMHFLYSAFGGKYRDGMKGYMLKLLNEEGGGARDLAQALGVKALKQLDDDYDKYLQLVIGAQDDEATQKGLAAFSAEARDAVTPELIPIPIERDDWLAIALGRAADGDYEGAISVLERAQLGAEDKARLTVEVERLKTLIATRDVFLAAIIGTKTRVKLPHEGKLPVTITAVEADALTLGKNKAALETWSKRNIMPTDLATAMTRKIADYGPEWVLAYAHLLNANDRYDRYLDATDGATTSLVSDAAGYTTLLRSGEASQALTDLATWPRVGNEPEVQAITAAIKTVLDDYGDLSVVQRKLGDLKQLARRSWGEIYDQVGIEALASVPAEALGAGRIRLTYEFTDAKELDDFERVTGYLAQRRVDSVKVKKSEEKSGFVLKNGNFQGDGQVCYRSRLSFDAPMTVRYQLLYGRPRPGKGTFATFRMGICDDGDENYIGAIDVFHLEAIDIPGSHVQLAYEEGENHPEPAKTYNIELSHDGSKAVLTVNRQIVKEVDVGPRQAGAVFFWVHADILVALKRIEIEGRISPTMLEEARPGWVADKIAVIGFPD